MNNWLAYFLGLLTIPVGYFIYNLVAIGIYYATEDRLSYCLPCDGYLYEGWAIYVRFRRFLHVRTRKHRDAFEPWNARRLEELAAIEALGGER